MAMLAAKHIRHDACLLHSSLYQLNASAHSKRPVGLYALTTTDAVVTRQCRL